MLFVCHPKFCIWYVMVFLEGSIVRKLSRHYRRRIQVLHPNNFRSVSLFSCLIVLFLCFFFFHFVLSCPWDSSFLFSFSLRLYAGFCLFLFQLRLLCNYSLFSDLLFARLTGCIHFGMLRYFHVSFAHCSLLFFRLPFDSLSLVISLFYLSYSLVSLPFCARVFI